MEKLFYSKGHTLKDLSKILKNFKVPKIFIFNYSEWKKNIKKILRKKKKKFKKKKIKKKKKKKK